MASIFSQSFCQPQAMSHLSNLISGVRAMSSNPTTARQPKYNNQHKSGRKTEQSSTKKDDGQVLSPLQISDLSFVLKDLVHKIQSPTSGLVRSSSSRPGLAHHWRENHVSAQSFFENQTGFPKSELNADGKNSTSYLPAMIQSAMKTQSFQRIFSSLAQNQFHIQQRGFKTRRSDKTQGIGTHSNPESSILDNIPDFFNTRSDKKLSEKLNVTPNTVGSPKETLMGSTGSNTGSSATLGSLGAGTDSDTERRINLAFVEGYKAKEQLGKKNTGSSIRSILTLAFILWLSFQLFSSVFSMRSGGSLGLFSGSNYEVNPEDVSVNFDDVKGAAEAKEELQDIVNFLKDPDRYTSIGAKLPKGVLLIGPPGVGKTLLARAVAGEASVPFFHAAGSEFDEMFVGLGAKRIRQLFSAAKQAAPCIIFIDEFDSVGAKRTNSAIHPYANQTINQLLSEMDGFQQNEGIIVLGATNKVENLDKALRRPGRFDIEVTVSLPDFQGRKEIIELYISKVKKDPNVDVDKLAKGTTGFSGAELENLINQAALKAAIDSRETITMAHLEFARDKILMGPERKHKIPDDETNWLTAYHEAGHTLVAYYTKEATPLHKVTIIPRGQSLGHTSFLDEKEIYNRTVAQLKASMDTAMGGRAAEEIIYGTEKVTTGASSDLKQATQVATAMVMVNGMSEKVGLRSYSDLEISPYQREIIDQEIKRLMQEAYERAKAILKSHNTELHELAKALMKYETLDKDEIKAVVEGRKIAARS